MNIHRMVSLAVLCCGVAAASSASADGGASSILRPGEVLFPGQHLVSDSCYYHLDMQSDGNLVVYNGPGTEFPSYASATQGNFRPFYNNDTYAILQYDGNFVEYAAGDASALWYNRQARDQYGVIWMQDDGNLVEYPESSGGSNAWWQSNTVDGEKFGSSPCNFPASKTLLVENIDYSAGTNDVFATSCTNSFVDCGVACAQNGACKAWTWIPANTPNSCSSSEGKCWFKSNQPGPVTSEGAVAGLIETAMPSGD